MSPRKKTTIPAIGPDVDLDTEEVYLSDGTRLDEARAAQIAETAMGHHYRVRGRPSVTGGGEHTPRLTVRVPRGIRAKLEDIAASQGRRLADVSRDALDEYAQRHAG
jgi:hypothetical protein